MGEEKGQGYKDRKTRLRESFRFYDWDASVGEVRWVCSFDTTESDIDALIEAIARATNA